MKFVSGTESQINCRKEIHFRYFNQVPKGDQSIEEMLSFYQKQNKRTLSKITIRIDLLVVR